MPTRPCWVEISTDAFEENFKILTAACRSSAAEAARGSHLLDESAELLAIVKANAYGHGLELCAPAAARAGARWLGVTSVEEGVEARAACGRAGQSCPCGQSSRSGQSNQANRANRANQASRPEPEILVIGGPFAGQGGALVEHGLTPVVWEPWQCEELEAAACEAACAPGAIPVHLELETGMSRQGVDARGLDGLLARFDSGSPLRLTGLMTHLYAPDESGAAATREQFARLEGMVERVFGAGFAPQWLHVGNSATVSAGDGLEQLRGICRRFGMRAMARPGLALYGMTPEFSPSEPERVGALRSRLRRVLEWKTRVVGVRSVEPGAEVGYNGTFVATEPMRLALLAVGYADGLRRELSNRGYVLVRGARAPIVGRISMDQTVADVTGIAGVAAGDEAVLLGRQGGQEIAAQEHARWAGTIPWEILAAISGRVERRQRESRNLLKNS